MVMARGSQNNSHHPPKSSDAMEVDKLPNSGSDESSHDEPMGVEDESDEENGQELDCYPYTFSPLLLFAPSHYFDKGHSNYNSVARFFSHVTTPLGIDMLENVLYERKNMLYEELIEHVIQNEMLITCCIDSHFTALKVILLPDKKPTGIYYDPMKPRLYRVSDDSFHVVLIFLLLKCNYGDSQHIQGNQDYYSGVTANATRRAIHKIWQKVNVTPSPSHLQGVNWTQAPLTLSKYVLINDKRNPTLMSVQLSSNTCYFQSYLFALLCKIGEPVISSDGKELQISNVDKLGEVTTRAASFLLEFFVQMEEPKGNSILRPLTNSNFILDFYRYKTAPYHATLVDYLASRRVRVPDYERQYHETTRYYWKTKILHKYDKFSQSGAMASTPNSKFLQDVTGSEGAVYKLARSDYYKYRAANFMFGWNSGIMNALNAFYEFNSLRKNQLLRFYDVLYPLIHDVAKEMPKANKKTTRYRDYYFMGQFEVGQKELIDLHHYFFLVDYCALSEKDANWTKKVHAVNARLVEHVLYSFQQRHNYEKLLSLENFYKSKKAQRIFLESFMSTEYFAEYVALGFSEIDPNEKEVTALTQSVFQTVELMRHQANRQEYEFEKECINQMARSSIRKYITKFHDRSQLKQTYKVHIKIGEGYTYSKYNTLMHFLNVAECYWRNPDLSNTQVFGKDIRTLLVMTCQKIFFHEGHSGYYNYGPFESGSSPTRSDLDLAVASNVGHAIPGVARTKKPTVNELIITDRVFEYNYLKTILHGFLERCNGIRIKSDNIVLNMYLLSLMLDFGLYEKYVGLLNLPFLHGLQHQGDTKELQVEVANQIYDFDRKNTSDSVTRSKVEEMLFEVSYKFLINKDFPVHSRQFKLIRELNSDSDYQRYVLLVKVYMSLCQINKSVEVDYYKVRCDEEFRIIIPTNFSKITSTYLEEVSRRYTFSERGGIMVYDDLPVFDLRPQQPEINLYRIRFNSASHIQSMVKYIEISNVFQVNEAGREKYLVFMADNALEVEVSGSGMGIQINKVAIEVATIFFNEAISFIPCFKYADSEDVVLFTSRNINYLVDQGGQFSTDYYGMRHELIDFIKSDEGFVDLNDEHVFKSYKLSELLTESKTVIYFPDYLLQVPDRQHLINLLDLALQIRNVSFFVLVLFYLRRTSISLEFIEKEHNSTRISGPWKEGILYVLGKIAKNSHYDAIFSRQFFNLNQHRDLPLEEFIDALCTDFTRYQRYVDGQYQIVPTDKQKEFLKRIICGEECFHFSEVGTGKTKVILPLLCQTFLSNNIEAHKHLARKGKQKHVLVLLVPEHLVTDARTQVFRYCLNLNFREDYRVYDDIFALKHRNVQLGIDGSIQSKGSTSPMKHIFVTSFNQFKKALTYDAICSKVQPYRENILVVADEVDDFLDRNKLIFNICSNKANSFDKPTLDLFYEISRSAYHDSKYPDVIVENSGNPTYWKQLHTKFCAIHKEIQDASRSINKNFGIFNEYTLRHCTSNIMYDIEGYKSLIARPYESVNRAMPGSYYSDVERTIYLTYVILTEDLAKYDDLFQSERKFISFEYWNAHLLHYLDFDDLVYGHEKLSEIVDKHPQTKDALVGYLYSIVLRRMEIRDKSRSVSSIDVIFNFDCIGFTGTPFLDNYPTFDYIRKGRQDAIPNLIDRSFYAYTSEHLPTEEFQRRFALFQGKNNNVFVDYVSSDFISEAADEMEILESIFERESRASSSNPNAPIFNVVVDLCGIFKRSTIHDVRKMLNKYFGQDRFHYIYHIDQRDNSDRILSTKSENDVQYDEEFYKHACKTYGKGLRDRIFFFVDNRNVIGKDVPFQLLYQKQFGQALFAKSVVLAHDVDDFSKLWQAMGRSRTMNETIFSIYKSGLPTTVNGLQDIKLHALTQYFYVKNCDSRMAGNISSIYLTLVALLNLSQNSFYYPDDVLNLFLLKMQNTVQEVVSRHEEQLIHNVLGNPVTAQILWHILVGKFRRSPNPTLANVELKEDDLEAVLHHVVQQNFEQRVPSGDIFDDMIIFLSGDQKSQMEISYTKQQQQQKQKQQNKNEDSDAMRAFDKQNRLSLSFKVDNYYDETLKPLEDMGKVYLNLPVSIPIFKLHYKLDGRSCSINIYPTVQFLYSHHVRSNYITSEVQSLLKSFRNASHFYNQFFETVKKHEAANGMNMEIPSSKPLSSSIKLEFNKIRQNPQYTLAALRAGVYVIGMKEQFNIYDLRFNPLHDHVQYVADDNGFILFDKTKSKRIDQFGPYFIEQYILMEMLSKQEIAQNVVEYFCNHRELLQRKLESYDEQQGQGFVCWRFLMNETGKAATKRAAKSME